MCQNGRSAEIELQPDLAQTGAPHGGAKTRFVFGIENEEAAAARANQLAAKGSRGASQAVHFIDKSAAHSGRTLLLVLPMNVHEFGKLAQIAGQKRVPAFVAQLLG